MRTLFDAIVSAFSTFSVFPTPRVEWRADSLKGILCALPLVGAVIGGFGCLYFWLSDVFKLPAILSAVVFTILPVALSGGIHMDGFADTVDALSSRAEPEKKRAILKDPHAGAFAVIGVCCYLLLYFGLCATLPLDWKTIGLFGITHVLSRAVGSLAGTVLPSASKNGMLKTFRDARGTADVWILAVWIVLSLAGAAILSPAAACAFLLLGTAAFFGVRHTANKQFGGMSGDLAGYCISLSSLLLLFGLVLSERIVTLWF